MNSMERGFMALRQSAALRLWVKGCRALYRGYWSVIGRFDPYMVMSGYFAFSGAVLIYLVSSFPDTSIGLDGFVKSQSGRVGVGFGFVAMGWMIAMFRNRVILTVGSLVALWYALSTAIAIQHGTMDDFGWPVVVYIVFGTVGILGFASSVEGKRELRQRIERTEAEHAALLATLKVKRLGNGQDTGRIDNKAA